MTSYLVKVFKHWSFRGCDNQPILLRPPDICCTMTTIHFESYWKHQSTWMFIGTSQLSLIHVHTSQLLSFCLKWVEVAKTANYPSHLHSESSYPLQISTCSVNIHESRQEISLSIIWLLASSIYPSHVPPHALLNWFSLNDTQFMIIPKVSLTCSSGD